MNSIISSIKTYAKAHKRITGATTIIAILVFYWAYSAGSIPSTQTKYVLGTAQTGTIVSAITGSGQVSVTSQMDLKAKSSGDVIYLTNAISGTPVMAGTLLAEIDPTNAQKTVRDAQANLDKEKLNLQKLQGGIINETEVRGSIEKATADLDKSYESAFSDVSGAFTDFPSVLLGLQNIIYSTTLTGSDRWNMNYYSDTAAASDPILSNEYKADVFSSYQEAQTAYAETFSQYKTVSLTSDRATIDALLVKTYTAAKVFSEAVKNSHALVQLYHDSLTQKGLKPSSISETDLTNLNSYTSKISSVLSSLSNDAAEVQTKKESLSSVSFSLADQQLAVTKSEESLADAKATLAECYIRAPFNGILSKISVNKGDTVSSGTLIATVITSQKTVQIPLNEVDVVKVKSGQKATFTFDAVSGLTLTGHVSDVDVSGTVSQGVVTYNVKLAFDSDDERVKPGMSTSASIITDIKTDVLTVPNSAVKNQNGVSYVEIYDGWAPVGEANAQGVLLPSSPVRQTVQTGISSDSLTEIISGLKEGQRIVARTVTSSAAKPATQATSGSILNIGGSGGVRGGGNATFIRAN